MDEDSKLIEALSGAVSLPIDGRYPVAEAAPVFMALSDHKIISQIEKKHFGHLEVEPPTSMFSVDKLIARSQSISPEKTIEWLYRLESIQKARIRLIVEIRGVRSEEDFEFKNGVKLLSIGTALKDYDIGDIGKRTDYFYRPMVAIVESEVKSTAEPGTLDNIREKIRSVMLGLATNSKVSSGFGGLKYEFIDEDLKPFNDSWWLGMHFEELDTSEVMTRNEKDRAERFIALTGGIARKASIAAERLALARRRGRVADKVIDTAIALEALLLEHDVKSEMTHKIAVRSALLLKVNLEDRLKIRRSLKAFYGVRSAIVHGNEMATNTKEVNEFVEIAGLVLQAIVDMGREPNWPNLDVGFEP